MSVPTLLVDDGTGMRWRLEERRPYRFGRSSEVEMSIIDPGTARPNPSMSRHVGTFEYTGERWMVETAKACSGRIELIGPSGVPLILAPGSRSELPGVGRLVITPMRHVLTFRIPGAEAAADVETVPGTETQFLVPLTPRQVDYLVVLAEPELLARPGMVRRPIKEIARVWSRSSGAVEEALREVAKRLHEFDLIDRDDLGRPGVNDAVARVVVEAGLITRADHEWAALEPGPPRRSADGPRFSEGTGER